MALITTPGASDADSYENVAGADAYHDTHLYADDWTGAEEGTKEKALQMAARLLDAMPGAWTGTAATSTQALGWPRTGMLTRNGFVIASGVIPNELKNAQSEYARQLIAADRTEDNAIVAQGITSLKAGSVALTFKDDLDRWDSLYAMVPDAVRALLVPSWLQSEEDVREDEARTGLVVEVL